MDNFFESGIYIVIVAVATLICLIVILMMAAAMKPVKKKGKARSLSAGKQNPKLAGPDIKLLAEAMDNQESGGKNSKKGKKGKKEKEKGKGKQPKVKVVAATADQSQHDGGTAPGKAEKEMAPAGVTALQSSPEPAPVEDPKVADLPALETLDENADDVVDDEQKEDLMSIFQIEEEQDSYVSDLANKLFDVETSNLQSLGLEVLAALTGNRESDSQKEEQP